MTPGDGTGAGTMRVPVVHIITRLEFGGAQQNTLHTVAHLDRARFAPWLVCGRGGLLDEQARALPDVPVHFLPSLVRPIHPVHDLRAVLEIRRLLAPLARQGPVVVHTHSSKAGIVGRWAARAAGAGPVLHSIHGWGHPAVRNPALRRVVLGVERHMARHTHAFLSVARHHIDEGRRQRLLGDRPAYLVRSGIDLESFAQADALRAQARASLELPAQAPVVGMVACLKPQKAPLDFVDVAAQVLQERPETHFFLAGDGELREAVQQRVARHGLGSRFRVLGWRTDAPALMGALDVLMLTSRWEGLPRVCPQAMAAGRPVVATDVDGIPEAIVDGRNGLLFEAGDTRAAAGHVLRLLGDEGLRRRMAAAGQEAVGEFDQTRMVREQEHIYAGLLGW